MTDRPARSSAPLTCSGCSNTWTGVTRCHCSGCRRTFGGLRWFDRHRVNGACIDPAMITNRETGDPVMKLRGAIWGDINDRPDFFADDAA